MAEIATQSPKYGVFWTPGSFVPLLGLGPVQQKDQEMASR